MFFFYLICNFVCVILNCYEAKGETVPSASVNVEPLVNSQVLENGIEHTVSSQPVPDPQENVKISKDMLNSNPSKSTEVQPSTDAESVNNGSSQAVNKTDTPTKNKHNLTFSIPRNEESSTNEIPFEYQHKYELGGSIQKLPSFACKYEDLATMGFTPFGILERTLERTRNFLHYREVNGTSRTLAKILKLIKGYFEKNHPSKGRTLLFENITFVLILSIVISIIRTYLNDRKIRKEQKEGMLRLQVEKQFYKICVLYDSLELNISSYKRYKDTKSYRSAVKKLFTKRDNERKVLKFLLEELKKQGADIDLKAAKLWNCERLLLRNLQKRQLQVNKLISKKYMPFYG